MDKNIKPLTLLEMSEAAQKRVNLIYREFSEGFEFIKNYLKVPVIRVGVGQKRDQTIQLV